MKKILPITLTETAVKKIFEIRGQKQIGEEYYLRLGVKSTGCGIASYIIGFDYKNDKDDLFEIGNVKVII